MKKLKAIATGAFFILSAFFSQAQEKAPFNNPDYSKPKLFADLPQKMNLKLIEAKSLLNLSVGASVNIQLTEQFHFKGMVVSKSNEKDASVSSIVIRSANREGATLTLTKIMNADGSFTFSGRILSLKNGDAFELVQEKGQYFFQKKNLYEMIAE